jgi:hypothetical protein
MSWRSRHRPQAPTKIVCSPAVVTVKNSAEIQLKMLGGDSAVDRQTAAGSPGDEVLLA